MFEDFGKVYRSLYGKIKKFSFLKTAVGVFQLSSFSTGNPETERFGVVGYFGTI